MRMALRKLLLLGEMRFKVVAGIFIVSQTLYQQLKATAKGVQLKGSDPFNYNSSTCDFNATFTVSGF